MSDARKALLVIGVRTEAWPRRSQYCDVETLSSTASLWCVFILTYYYGKQIKCKVVWHLYVNKKLLLIAALWRLRRNTRWVEGGSFPFNESTRVTIIEEQGHIIKMRFGWHCFWKWMRHLQRKYCSGLAIWRFSLTPTSGLHIRKNKTGCRGPCAQSAHGAAWRTTMETRSVTGSRGTCHSCRHFLSDRLMKTSASYQAKQQLLKEKKRGREWCKQC